MNHVPHDLTRTAWHEAGHAMAYLAHGRRFRYVTTRPRTPGLAGRICVRPSRIDPFIYAVIAHCGPQTEGCYLLSSTSVEELEADGVTPDDVITGAYLSNGDGDLEAIRDALAAVGVTSDDPTERVARMMVVEQWPVVERLAAGLLAHRSLTYEQAVHLAHRGEDGDRP